VDITGSTPYLQWAILANNHLNHIPVDAVISPSTERCSTISLPSLEIRKVVIGQSMAFNVPLHWRHQPLFSPVKAEAPGRHP